MSDEASALWAIYWFIVGWVFAPAFFIVLLLPVALWRWVFPPKPKPQPQYPSLPIRPPPPPPLTDEEFVRKMNQARLMRRRVERGLV